MQAIVKTRPGPGFDVRDVPEPQRGDGEVLLKVLSASICGSDVHLYDWSPWVASRVNPPRIIGHELCGEVVTGGKGTDGLASGTRVAVESHIICGHCPECRRGESHVCAATKILGVDTDGGFTSFVSVPAKNVWPVEQALPPEVAAAMEPFGNAVHACSYGSLRGATVLILGCGFIGCACVAIAKAEGATQIIAADRNSYRLELARRLGADTVVNVDATPLEDAVRRSAAAAVDCALEMSGAPESVVGATKLVRAGGWISLLGLSNRPATLNVSDDIVMKGLTLHGVIGRRLPESWQKADAYIRSGSIDLAALITHRFPLEGIDEAMQLMKSGECGKVALTV